jgi:hypothetical protein
MHVPHCSPWCGSGSWIHRTPVEMRGLPGVHRHSGSGADPYLDPDVGDRLTSRSPLFHVCRDLSTRGMASNGRNPTNAHAAWTPVFPYSVCRWASPLVVAAVPRRHAAFRYPGVDIRRPGTSAVGVPSRSYRSTPVADLTVPADEPLTDRRGASLRSSPPAGGRADGAGRRGWRPGITGGLELFTSDGDFEGIAKHTPLTLYRGPGVKALAVSRRAQDNTRGGPT